MSLLFHLRTHSPSYHCKGKCATPLSILICRKGNEQKYGHKCSFSILFSHKVHPHASFCRFLSLSLLLFPFQIWSLISGKLFRHHSMMLQRGNHRFIVEWFFLDSYRNALWTHPGIYQKLDMIEGHLRFWFDTGFCAKRFSLQLFFIIVPSKHDLVPSVFDITFKLCCSNSLAFWKYFYTYWNVLGGWRQKGELIKRVPAK